MPAEADEPQPFDELVSEVPVEPVDDDVVEDEPVDDDVVEDPVACRTGWLEDDDIGVAVLLEEDVDWCVTGR